MLNGESWKAELRMGLDELLERTVRAGARADQVFDALSDELQTMKSDWVDKSNPHRAPVAGVLDEPANDWPGAER